MRVLIRFLLSLCFLLLRGYFPLYAHAYHARACCSSKKILEQSAQAGFVAVQNKDLIRKATSSNTGKVIDRIKAEEVEDEDESFSLRKHADISSYFIGFFYAHVLGYFLCCKQKRLPFCEHFSYTASNKCILNCVIRI